MKPRPKQNPKYRTDLRINATPEQVRAALVRGGAPRQKKSVPIHRQSVR